MKNKILNKSFIRMYISNKKEINKKSNLLIIMHKIKFKKNKEHFHIELDWINNKKLYKMIDYLNNLC